MNDSTPPPRNKLAMLSIAFGLLPCLSALYFLSLRALFRVVAHHIESPSIKEKVYVLWETTLQFLLFLYPLGFLAAITAIALAYLARYKLSSSPKNPTAEKMATSGLRLGCLGIILTVAALYYCGQQALDILHMQQHAHDNTP
jgi:hypothetical protein